MEQRPSYHTASYTHFVYCLYKAIYGLKQTPRAWFESFVYSC